MYQAALRLPAIAEIAVVRFSALGDLALVAPAVMRLREHLPDARITWITSPLGYALLQGLDGINFEVFDKPRTLADYRNFYRAFRQRRFDAVLAMQANLRINLLYPALHAPIKIGFDLVRAREGQWLFCNRSIPFADEHLADSFMAFATQLGAPLQPMEWHLPISVKDKAWAHNTLTHLPHPLIAIHPCTSKSERNWPFERYAELLSKVQQHTPVSFVFTGGNNDFERDFCARLAQHAGKNAFDLCGCTSPKQLAAVLGEADVLIAPDTAAVHLARAMDTPVIGLYAVASPKLTGPYQRDEFIVDRHPDAVRQFLRKDVDQIAWNTRVHDPAAMSLITADDVLKQLMRVLQRC